ncbi:hypothetical protein D3C85_1134100 [compost metagenome]
MAIDQPPLKGRGDSRGRDNGPRGEQGLKNWLMGSRIGEKYDRLAPDQQGAAGEALNDTQRDQQVQLSRDCGHASCQAHGQGRADDHMARMEAVQQPGRGHEADELERGVADIQPGELIRRRMGIADDVAAPERQHGAGDRFRQRGKHYARHKQESGRRSAVARHGGGKRCHDPLPSSISTRADRPGTMRPGNGLLANRIFTGTRCTTRTKFPVALSVGSRLNADPLPGAKLSTTPSSAPSG